MNLLYKIRSPKRAPKNILVIHTILLLLAGLSIGALAKIFDQYNEFLGTMFSEFSIWFLLCTAIAIYSTSPARASLNVLVFCAGMLIAYYLTADTLGAVWSSSFAYGWTAFALCLPVFAFFAWFALGKGKLAMILRIGILAIMVLSQVVLFKLRVSDIVIIGVTAFLLLRRKIKMETSK